MQRRLPDAAENAMPDDKARKDGDTEDEDSDAWLDTTRMNEDLDWADKTHAEPQSWSALAPTGAAEDEDSDRTEVGRPPPVAEPLVSSVGLKLACVAGPFLGREFILNDDNAVIGRAPENIICIPDQSISRRHARLTRVGSRWTVTDLQSDNGTRLNGLPLAGEVLLGPGDLLTVGDTQIKFLEGIAASDLAPPFEEQTRTMPQVTVPLLGITPILPVPALKKAPPSAPRRTAPRPGPSSKAAGFVASPPARHTQDLPAAPAGVPRARSGLPSRTKARRDAEAVRKRRVIFLWATLGVSLLLIPVFVRVTLGVMKRRREAELEAIHLRATDVFARANNLLRAGRWKEAKAELLKAKQLDPTYPLQDFLTHVDREIAAQAVFEQARAALDQNQLGQAAELLQKVASETTQKGQVVAIRKTLVEKRDVRVEQARAALDEGHADDALAIVKDVLRAIPDDGEALRLRDRVLSQKAP